VGILAAFVPSKTKRKWKRFRAARHIDTSALISRFLEAYMSPLSGCLDATMSLRAKCDKCGKPCGLVYIKSEKCGCDFAYSACCRSAFKYVGDEFWSAEANKHLP